jgi:hypothetical protein
MRKKSAAGPGSGLADFGRRSTSGFWQRIFFTSGARQTEERGAQSAAGDLPILRDPGGGYNLWDLHSKELNVQKYTSDHFNIRNRCNLVRDVDWHPHLPVLAASRYVSEDLSFHNL